jgi:hypothetical protein
MSGLQFSNILTGDEDFHPAAGLSGCSYGDTRCRPMQSPA